MMSIAARLSPFALASWIALTPGCRPEPAAKGTASPPAETPAETSADTAVAPPAQAASRGEEDSAEARRLRAQLLAYLRRDGSLRSDRVMDAMQRVPRHLFIPELSIPLAYSDQPLPIGEGQTISQPAVVASMTEALELGGKERVLEIGTGSGYQAAILGLLAARVWTIEIVAPLGEKARARLAKMGYANVEVRIGDGYAGWPEHAPFDRILLTAAPPEVPKALIAQLAEGGVLVAPVGPEGETQKLLRLRKLRGQIREEDLGRVRFVPMVPGR